MIGVHEGVRAALQFGADPARLFELEGAGAGPGDVGAFDAVARQQVAGMPGLCRPPRRSARPARACTGLRQANAKKTPRSQILRSNIDHQMLFELSSRCTM